jgi:ABC-2 type transport system permease protein
MFRHIAAFELRYQLRWPVFWATTLIFALFAFGSIASTVISIGSTGNVKVNSPYAIAQTLQILSVFAVFIIAAFVSNVIVRDDETNFGSILRSTRVSRFNYLYGRFTGSFIVACLAFAGVPLAMLAGSMMPWVDAETVGPLRLNDYAYVYFVLCLPSLFVVAAFCFALATLTRSVLGTYIGVVAFIALYFVATQYFDEPDYEAAVALYEPFGIGAFQLVTKYWTATERNTQLPAIEGVILYNRAIYFAAAFVLLTLAGLFYRPARASKPARKVDKLIETVKTEVIASELPMARDTTATTRAQFFAMVRFDMRSVFRSPAFFVMIGIGFLNAMGSVWVKDSLFGTPIYPVTTAMITALTGSFIVMALIIAIFYAGELVWRDRERRIHEIVDACPTPEWVFVLPKIIAIAVVLLVTVAISVAAGLIAQLSKGYWNVELQKYLQWYVLPRALDMTLIAVLAVFIQVVVPNKYVGWLVMLLFIVSQYALRRIGFEHNLYQYAGGPEVPLSDMNGQGNFALFRAWFQAYWSAIAVLLVVLSYSLWRRGTDARLFKRLKRFPRQLAGTPAAIAAFALVIAAGLGAFIYYNTAVINEYRTDLSNEAWAADYEKTLLPFEKLPQPRVVNVTLTVDVYPHEPRVVTVGTYTIENRTLAPLEEVHIHWERDTQMRQLEISGAKLKTDYPRFAYRIYRFDRPLAPGGRRDVRFITVREQRGFLNSNNQHRIVDNGTFINNTEIAPFIGMSRNWLLVDRPKRRKHGLPAELRPAKLEDSGARAWQVMRRDSDWVKFDITVSTVADQIPIAPGYPVSDSTTAGRRTIRYQADAPMMHFFSVQSAAYAVKRDKWNDVDLAVYYDRAHPYNIDRMIKAMKASLTYCSREFNNYQFRQLRILEFPGYERFAQSFANTVPYSERIGFISNHQNPEEIDVVTYVTAHEVAHQWWGHQIIGGDMQGTALLVETLSQYSALMVMEKTYGPDQIRRFLKYELDRYLRSRGGEVLEELPLERVEDQQYIYYQKGSLAMYLLKDVIGEEAVNRALRGFLTEYAFKAAPYPTSRDLIRYLRIEAGSEQQLVTDLFEKITLYDAKVTQSRTRRLPDGKWEAQIEVDVHKYYANGQGVETEIPVEETFDVGAFTLEPATKGFSRRNVLKLERQPIKSGVQTLTLVTDREPKFVGIDPYNKRVDRNSQDNVTPVGAGTPARATSLASLP